MALAVTILLLGLIGLLAVLWPIIGRRMCTSKKTGQSPRSEPDTVRAKRPNSYLRG